jgi:hypothetical protein
MPVVAQGPAERLEDHPAEIKGHRRAGHSFTRGVRRDHRRDREALAFGVLIKAMLLAVERGQWPQAASYAEKAAPARPSSVTLQCVPTTRCSGYSRRITQSQLATRQTCTEWGHG